MDLVDTPGDSDLCPEEGADTIHFCEDAEYHEDHHPSRPISRLGFNIPASSAGSPERHDTPNSEAIQWSRSLFQNIGISDLRLSTLKTHPEADTTSSARSALEMEESGIPVPSNSENRFESPYGNAVEKYAKVDRKSPPTSSPSVSRLCFPFVTTPSPRRNKSPPSLRLQRHKYSCFPSLMSPGPATNPSPSHQRHNYGQHGYSRLALQNLKSFWTVREHEWNTDLHSADTHGVSSGAHLDRHDVIHTSNRVQNLPPVTIYPRRGDIAALRDLYSFHIDRCFAGFESWTIGKILWMLDMHAAMEKRAMEASIEEDVSDEESESELETSASTGYSDDSDSTLVESENESDLLNMRSAILGSPRIDNDETAAQSSQALSVGYLDNTSWSQSMYTKISNPKRSDGDKLPWATNWYGRWALLVEISRGDKDPKHLHFESTAPPMEFIPIKHNTGHQVVFGGKEKDLADDEPWNFKLGKSDN